MPWGLLRWPGGSQGREGVAGASTGGHCPESLWLFLSSSLLHGLCQGSRCFGQRRMEGESMWVGEMGVWSGHVGLICWCMRWCSGTQVRERCWDGAKARSTGCTV